MTLRERASLTLERVKNRLYIDEEFTIQFKSIEIMNEEIEEAIDSSCEYASLFMGNEFLDADENEDAIPSQVVRGLLRLIVYELGKTVASRQEQNGKVVARKSNLEEERYSDGHGDDSPICTIERLYFEQYRMLP